MAAKNPQAQVQQWFEEHSSDVYRFLLSLTRSDVESDDLFQETFLAALKGYKPGIANPKSWLFRIAHNKFLNQQGRRQRESRSLEQFAEQMETSSNADPDWPILAERIIEDLHQIDPIFATIFICRVDNEMTQAEIVEALGIPRRTLARHLDKIKAVILSNYRSEIAALEGL